MNHQNQCSVYEEGKSHEPNRTGSDIKAYMHIDLFPIIIPVHVIYIIKVFVCMWGINSTVIAYIHLPIMQLPVTIQIPK